MPTNLEQYHNPKEFFLPIFVQAPVLKIIKQSSQSLPKMSNETEYFVHGHKVDNFGSLGQWSYCRFGDSVDMIVFFGFESEAYHLCNNILIIGMS